MNIRDFIIEYLNKNIDYLEYGIIPDDENTGYKLLNAKINAIIEFLAKNEG